MAGQDEKTVNTPCTILWHDYTKVLTVFIFLNSSFKIKSIIKELPIQSLKVYKVKLEIFVTVYKVMLENILIAISKLNV